MQVSPVLRKGNGFYSHWCPGCKHAHIIYVDAQSGPNWSFDGNVDCPTFSPSIRIYTPAQPADGDDPAEPERTICHYFIKAGQIEYCGDCEHMLNGQTVPMVLLGTIGEYGWSDSDA